MPCTLPNCLVCLNGSYCSVCDWGNGYAGDGVGGCQYCDPVVGSFVNVTAYVCQDCALLECVTCASLTVCSQCNQTNNYFLNVTDNHCILCSIPDCALCSNLNVCLNCSTGFLLNSTNLCQTCSQLGCINCSTLTLCYECNQT